MAKIPTFIFWGQSNMRGKGTLGELNALRPSQYPTGFQGKYDRWYWWQSSATSSNPAIGSVVEMDFQLSRYGTDAGIATGALAVSGANHVLTDPTKEWPTNLLVGALLTIGLNSAPIVSNTGNTITVVAASWLPAAPVPPLVKQTYTINNQLAFAGTTTVGGTVQLSDGS